MLPEILCFLAGKQKAFLKAFVFALMSKQKAKQMKFAFVQSKSIFFCFFALLFAFRFCFAHRCKKHMVIEFRPFLKNLSLYILITLGGDSARIFQILYVVTYTLFKFIYAKNPGSCFCV